MKELKFEEMASINGAKASGRGCMIAGGVTFGLAIGGVFLPALWGPAAAIASGAALSGCFDKL